MKIKKNDTVKILSGKDRGKKGKVTHSFPKDQRIVVDGINVRKKHMRPKKQGQSGQVVQMPMPVHVSKVMVVCPSCSKTTRIGKKVLAKKNIRVCKKCKAEIV